MDKVHPASIMPKQNIKKFMDKMRKKYRSINNVIIGGNDDNKIVEKSENSLNNMNEVIKTDIVEKSENNENDIIEDNKIDAKSRNDVERVNDVIKTDIVENNKDDNEIDYMYMGSLGTIIGEIGIILYWFLRS